MSETLVGLLTLFKKIAVKAELHTPKLLNFHFQITNLKPSAFFPSTFFPIFAAYFICL